MDEIWNELPRGAQSLALGVALVLAALVVHKVVTALVARAARRTSSRSDSILLVHLKQPSRYLLIAMVLIAAQPALALRGEVRDVFRQVMALIVPGLIGWMVIGLLGALNGYVQIAADISVEDNLRARRRRTRYGLLYRIALFIVLLVTFCLMLMSIPAVRSIGVTLIASAGLAALAVGAAAQPALKNLIGGLQMAFTEPIRLDDVVIVEGEWGRIEDIRLTYVVVKLWDERRLVVPVSRFLEQSFQNWTRETSQLLGSVFWYVDPGADIGRIRERLHEIVTASPRWDRRFWNLQVTDMKAEGAVELRALVTAKDASTAFDLRCDVREAMLAWLRAEMPEALVKVRIAHGDSRREADPPPSSSRP